MRTKTKWLIIVLAVVALITFNMAPAAFAKRGGGRGGGTGGGISGGEAAGSSGGGTSAASSGRSQSTTTEEDAGESDTDTGEESGEEGDDGALTRERGGDRVQHRHGHGGMREISEADVVERAERHADNIFDDLDTNEDGVIDADEAAAGSAEKAESVYDRMADRLGESDEGIEVDTDSRLAERLGDVAADGVVTQEELEAAFEDRLSEFDADGDGSITADELSDGMAEDAAERFDERDTNDDGVINADDRDDGEDAEGDTDTTEEEEETTEEEDAV